MSGANTIRAGGAVVEIVADKSAMSRTLNSAANELNQWSANAARIGAGLLGLGAGASTPLLLLTKEFAANGAQLDDLSQITGVSAQNLSRLGHAGNQSAAGIDLIAKSISKFQGSLQQPSEAADASLKSLGISAAEWRRAAPIDQFFDLIDAINAIENPSDRAAAAIDVFGKSGAELLPFIANGSQGIRDLMAEADALAITLTDEDAAAAASLDDELDKLSSSIKGAGNAIGAALAPDLEVLTKLTRELIVESVKWIRANPQIVTGIALVAGGTAAAGVGVLGLSVALKAGAVAATAASAAYTGAGVALTLLTSPAGIAVAAIAGVAVAVETSTGAISGSVASLKPIWNGMKTDALDTLAGVKAAIQAGDINLAMEVLWAGVDAIWARGVAAAKRKGVELVDSTIAVGREIKAGMIIAASGAWDSAVGLYDKGSDAVAVIVDMLGVDIANAWDSIGQGVREAGALFVAAWKYVQDKLTGETGGKTFTQYVRTELRETTDVTKERRETRTTELTERTRRRDGETEKRAAERNVQHTALVDEIGEQLSDAASAQAAERERRLKEANDRVDAAQKRLQDKIKEAKNAEAAARKETDKKPPNIGPDTDEKDDQDEKEKPKKPEESAVGTTQSGVASRLFYTQKPPPPPEDDPTNRPKPPKQPEEPVVSPGRANAEAADAAMIAANALRALEQPIVDNANAWTEWSDAVTEAAKQATDAIANVTPPDRAQPQPAEPVETTPPPSAVVDQPAVAGPPTPPPSPPTVPAVATVARLPVDKPTPPPPPSPTVAPVVPITESIQTTPPATQDFAPEPATAATSQPVSPPSPPVMPPPATAQPKRPALPTTSAASALMATAATFAFATVPPPEFARPTPPQVPALTPEVTAQINPRGFIASQQERSLGSSQPQKIEIDNDETLTALKDVVTALEAVHKEIAAMRSEGYA